MKHWDYDQYLETLGFENGPYLRDGEASLAPATRSLILVLTRPLKAEARELFLKMLEAMKVPESQLKHLELEVVALERIDKTLQSHTRVCLTMGFDVAGSLLTKPASPELRGPSHTLETWNGVSVHATYSPEDCLSDPNLKRPVWEDLQSLMRLMRSGEA